MRVTSHRFKIDKDQHWLWEYALYERRSFLGFVYWRKIKSSNYISLLEDYITEHKTIPRYYD